MTHATLLLDQLKAEFSRRMLGEYVPRIGRCVELLSEAQVWQRPGCRSNSVGNLLLHLAGNVRQWIQVGLGGAADARDRDAEFAADAESNEIGKEELMAQLRAAVEEADQVVQGLSLERLTATTTYQDRYQETGTAAVVHVIEHFSGHAGQIYAFTKQVLNIDLRFYDL